MQPFLKNQLIYLFLVMLGLHRCVGFSIAVAREGYSLVMLQGLLTAVPSLMEHMGSKAQAQ